MQNVHCLKSNYTRIFFCFCSRLLCGNLVIWTSYFCPVSYFQRLLYHIDTLNKLKLWLILFRSNIEKKNLCQNSAPCDGRILTVWNSKITNFKSFERKTSEKKWDMTTLCCSLAFFSVQFILFLKCCTITGENNH